MKKFILRSLIALLPILIVTAIYFIKDPFKVLYHYEAYAEPEGIPVVNTNDDYTGTETFLNNYPKYHYDAFVFGNSRGKNFHIKEWEKHIPSTNCFQFAVGNESIYGIERKLDLIDRQGGKVNYALFVIDHFVYERFAEDKKFPKHPLVSGKSMFLFKLNTFKGFFDKDFLIPYIYYLSTHKIKTGFFTGALNNKRYHYDVRANDAVAMDIDNEIDSDTGTYYKARNAIFYHRSDTQKYTHRVIGKEQIVLMDSIRYFLNKNHTQYKIVISPMYEQLRTDPADKAVLDSIFGKENIYDLSGINDITQNKYNYYEDAHYRYRVCNMIMDSIYKK